jgi:hypothetical protein
MSLECWLQEITPDYDLLLSSELLSRALIELPQTEIGWLAVLSPLGPLSDATREIVVREQSAIVEQFFGPVGDAVSGQQLLVLRERIRLGPGQPPQNAELDSRWVTPLNRESARPDSGLLLTDVRCAVGLGGNVPFEQDEVQTLKVAGEDQKIIAAETAKASCQRLACERQLRL